MKKNEDLRYQVTDEKEGKPVYYLMQYIIDNFDAIEYIKFNKDKVIEPTDEIEVWLEDGEEHRLDGPACTYADGSVDYYIEGDYKSWSFWNDPRVKNKIRKQRKEKIKKLNKK
jgi:hypothetical protein